MIRLVESVKTGRQFIATDALLKRADMRPVVETQVVKNLTDEASGVPVNTEPESEAPEDNQDDAESGGSLDLSLFSDEDLKEFAKSAPYNINVTHNMRRDTIEKKLIEVMGE